MNFRRSRPDLFRLVPRRIVPSNCTINGAQCPTPGWQ